MIFFRLTGPTGHNLYGAKQYGQASDPTAKFTSAYAVVTNAGLLTITIQSHPTPDVDVERKKQQHFVSGLAVVLDLQTVKPVH